MSIIDWLCGAPPEPTAERVTDWSTVSRGGHQITALVHEDLASIVRLLHRAEGRAAPPCAVQRVLEARHSLLPPEDATP
jgi:hypothetical protein